MEELSGMLVVAFGMFLIWLAVLIAIKPQLAERFLRSFASLARAHYTEQALRLIAAGAMVIFAPSMWYPAQCVSIGAPAQDRTCPSTCPAHDLDA
jgi:hypothetical protein